MAKRKTDDKNADVRKSIERHSSTWAAIERWARREIKESERILGKPGQDMVATEGHRLRRLVLLDLLGLPVAPKAGDEADAGFDAVGGLID